MAKLKSDILHVQGIDVAFSPLLRRQNKNVYWKKDKIIQRKALRNNILT